MDNLEPNISNKSSDFFESDADIAKRLAKDKKSKEVEKLGEPIQITSKVLSMKLVQAENPKYAYVTESGFIIRKINLEVILLIFQIKKKKIKKEKRKKERKLGIKFL